MLTRDSKLILGWLLLNSIPFGYMNVVPLVYLVDIGYDPAVVGAIYAAGAIANTVALIPFGFLADKYGRKKFLIIGGFLPFVSYLIFALTLNSDLLIVASAIGGVGLAGGLAVAIQSPALFPLLANSTTDKNRTSLFGVTQGVWVLALTIGALLSFIPGILSSALGQSIEAAHSNSYFLMAALVAISAIPTLFITERRGAAVERSAGQAEPTVLQRRTMLARIQSVRKRLPIRSGQAIAKFSLVYGLSGLGLGAVVQLLPTWYNLRYGTDESMVGLWIAAAEFVSLIGLPLIPRLVKSRGTLLTTIVPGIVSCGVLALIPFSPWFYLAALIYIARNVLVTISWPVLQSYVLGVVPEHERATTIAIASTAYGVTTSIGTFVGGALLGSRLLLLPFVIGVSGYIASYVVLYLLFRKVKPPEELEAAELKVV